MDGLLTPVSIIYKRQEQKDEDALVEISTSSPLIQPANDAYSNPIHISSTEEALKTLKNQPSFDDLRSVLEFLDKETTFSITSPGPLASQLVHVLVSEVIPNYWSILHEPSGKAKKNKQSHTLKLLLNSIRSITGINAILLNLKRLTQQSKETNKNIGGSSTQESLKIQLQLCVEVLGGESTIEKLWKAITNSSNVPIKQRALFNELLNLIGSGKIIGVTAEAEAISNELSKEPNDRYWIADGGSYSRWLGQNIIFWLKTLPQDADQEWKSCNELFGKCLRLGHIDNIAKEILGSLFLQKEEDALKFMKLYGYLPSFEQRNLLYTFLNLLSQDNLTLDITSEDDDKWWQTNTSIVSAAAKLINILIADNESRKDHLIAWLTNSSGAGIGEGVAIRRAAIASLSKNKKDMETILERSLDQFGDTLYIRHAPILQQEVHAQVLLLSAGYVHRMSPLRLTMIMRTGSHLSVVSNRLAASSPRARFLGMVIGEALSGSVDKGEKIMDFKLEETKTPEAKWYKSLMNVSDTIGNLEPLKSKFIPLTPKITQASKIKPSKKPNSFQGNSKIIAIEEIEDDDEVESDDDGLTPYAKPDSDVEDSDEDPTLIIRNKPTAPVYIRDLITYLRDTENYDRQKLALSTAASLIRRKANFGTEVSSHAEEIATLLVGLQDKYDIEDFQEMRSQAMIAILIALPEKMGQWFSKTFFDGDYSLAQRAAVLTTLGLGARELGGHGSEDKSLINSTGSSSSSFPSKKLPEAMHKYYSASSSKAALTATPNPVEALTTTLQNTFLAPLAAQTADALTGPNILKIRTFSSRLEVEKKRKKPISNALAKIVSGSFFFPLTGRFFIHLKAYGSNSSSNIAFQPYLLSLFLKTLSIILHSSGQSTLSLPQMTSEFWDLCLSLRTQAISDMVVQEALLFSFMTILEINEGDLRGLAERHGRELLETREWVDGVFKGIRGGSEEDERRRLLGAGVLVRIGECVEKYQRLMIGDSVGFA
ncbi:telomere binding protein [Ciborinia camelliae]|nr:telomere binding protein [Ciborinia camelliae]